MSSYQTAILFVKKYLIPILLILLGLYMILLYTKSETVIYKGDEVLLKQNSTFLTGGFALIIGGVISTLFIMEVINRMLTNILFVVLFFGASYVVYLNYNSVQTVVKWMEERDERYIEIKQRLEDVRDAQLAFKERYGVYAPSTDKLIRFVKNDFVFKIEREKSVPNGLLTREEMTKLGFPSSQVLYAFDEHLAWRLAQFPVKRPELEGYRRDTIKIPVMEALFTNDKAIAKRQAAPTKFDFHPDSLKYIPYSGIEIWMKADSIDRGEGKAPVFLAMDPQPFDANDTLKIGSLTELKTNGNWSSR